MSPSEVQKNKLEFETLRSRLETRESSTLTFSAVTTSASFAILTLLVTKETIPQVMYSLGSFFPLIGIFYRELTIFSIDRIEGKELRKLEQKLTNRNIPRPHWLTLIVRRFLVRIYLYLGFFAWLMLLFPSYSLHSIAATIIIPFAITIIHYVWEEKDGSKLKNIVTKTTALVLFVLIPLAIVGLVFVLFIPVYNQSSNITTTKFIQGPDFPPPLGYASLELTFSKQDLQDNSYDITLDLQVRCNRTPSVTYAFYQPETGDYSDIMTSTMQRNDTLGGFVGTRSFNASYVGWEMSLGAHRQLERYEPGSFPLDVYETPRIIIAANAEGSNSTNRIIMDGYDLTAKVPAGFSATISDYEELSDNETMSELANHPNLVNGLALRFRITFLRNTQSLPLLLVYLVGPSMGIWCMFSVTQFCCIKLDDRLKIFAGATLATFGYLLTFRNFAPPTLTWAEILVIVLIGGWAFLEMARAFASIWMKRETQLKSEVREGAK
jgi:hypothetical protein